MKVLLLGEYSGYFTNLREGLLELGHEVDMSSSGDGWKNFERGNLKLFSNNQNKIIRKLSNKYYQLSNVRNLKGYDIVQLVNPNIFGGLRYSYNQRVISTIKNNNEKLFLSNGGNHYFNYKVTIEELEYGYFKAIAHMPNEFNDKHFIKNNKDIVKIVDGIIPIMYTYAEAYRNHPKLLKTIPLPINYKTIKFLPQKLEDNKLKIFHGINREGPKGTKYIREAMERIARDYPNDVEIYIDGRMPLEKYLKVISEANIIIDQAYSYEYGMNAIYSMAMGKVVLSGNEPESQKEFGRDDIPIINIKPSADDIYKKLEQLIHNKQDIVEIGERSRKFVEDFHDYVKVAQQYVDVWNSVEVKK